MYQLTDKIIYLIVYIGLLVGIWLILFPIIQPFLAKRKLFFRFRRLMKEESQINKNILIKHLKMLLSVTYNIKSTYAVITFFVVSGIIFAVSFLVLWKSGKALSFALFLAATTGLIPYLILQIKLHNIRINSSYEAEMLIAELLNQYKIHYLNMVEAIDQTIPRLSKQPYSKKALLRLSLSVKQYRTQEQLEEIIQEFHFAINTSWSMLLANNLFLSIEFGDDVSEAMDDILNDLINLKQINEKKQQYNHESLLMIKYIAPVTFLLSIYAMFTIFGFTWDKYIAFQFQHPLGFKFFILTIILITTNYLIYFFIRKPKNDF